MKCLEFPGRIFFNTLKTVYITLIMLQKSFYQNITLKYNIGPKYYRKPYKSLMVSWNTKFGFDKIFFNTLKTVYIMLIIQL